MTTLGIKRKVRLGCIVLGMILFFSSMMSIYEFQRMNSYVTRVLSENIESINSSRDLLKAADDYNLQLMYIIDGTSDDYAEIDNADLILKFSDIHRRFKSPAEKSAADSVIFAYSAYMQVAREASSVWQGDQWQRRRWFFERLQPVYRQLNDYVQQLSFVSQDALIENSRALQDNFYRSMMPSMVSLILSLVLVLLFNYYLNYYLINPFLKVTKGILDYRRFNKAYSVKVDSEDEINELNSAVGDIIDLNVSYRRQLGKKE